MQEGKEIGLKAKSCGVPGCRQKEGVSNKPENICLRGSKKAPGELDHRNQVRKGFLLKVWLHGKYPMH